jgi:hypothetical protein
MNGTIFFQGPTVTKEVESALRILGFGMPLYNKTKRAVELRYVKGDESGNDLYMENSDIRLKNARDAFSEYALGEGSKLKSLFLSERPNTAGNTGLIHNDQIIMALIGNPVNLYNVLPRTMTQVAVTDQESKDKTPVTFNRTSKEIMLDLLTQGLLPKYANQLEGAFNLIWHYQEDPSSVFCYTHEMKRKGQKNPLYIMEHPELGTFISTENSAFESAAGLLASDYQNMAKFQKVPAKMVYVAGENSYDEDLNTAMLEPNPKLAKRFKALAEKAAKEAEARAQKANLLVAKRKAKKEESKAKREKLAATRIQRAKEKAEKIQMFKRSAIKSII